MALTGVYPVLMTEDVAGTADFYARHVIVAAPDGVLVDVITSIEPDPAFAAQFAEPSDQG